MYQHTPKLSETFNALTAWAGDPVRVTKGPNAGRCGIVDTIRGTVLPVVVHFRVNGFDEYISFDFDQLEWDPKRI